MPSLCVALDDVVLATVRCEEYEVVSVRFGGTGVDEALATLDMSAGRFPESGPSVYLTWIHDVELRPGQVVKVSLLTDQPTSHPGKTIEELFPDAPPPSPPEAPDLATVFAELRQQARKWPGFSFSATLPDGKTYAGQTTAEEHGFGFSVLWNWKQPERASFSLHTYTIDSVEKREPGKDHVRGHLQLGQTVAASLSVRKDG